MGKLLGDAPAPRNSRGGEGRLDDQVGVFLACRVVTEGRASPGAERVDGSEVLLEDSSIEEKQTVKSLILGVGGNAVQCEAS